MHVYTLKGEYFTMLTLNSIEDAEKACSELNDYQPSKNGIRLKAHIHPESCGKRTIEKQTMFKNIFRNIGPKNGEKKAKDQVEQLKEILQKLDLSKGRGGKLDPHEKKHKKDKDEYYGDRSRNDDKKYKEDGFVKTDRRDKEGDYKEKVVFSRKWDPPTNFSNQNPIGNASGVANNSSVPTTKVSKEKEKEKDEENKVIEDGEIVGPPP